MPRKAERRPDVHAERAVHCERDKIIHAQCAVKPEQPPPHRALVFGHRASHSSATHKIFWTDYSNLPKSLTESFG